ncbi:bifunctional 4-hydroxy-2-oxoglutarate aldolase/2-dehydro-3-deoxy-phosphogluconate aldolase [Mucilaginibacter auburnensis]|uniref:2-dehydro-3-deoxyphosphogluconate aldolase/(4S)-4-hydroxy-2-oxoglutarate aldolase n=1 Tax=Mucilaginibacter auburnensis TaxID=1457233 RepID=A0A2H9VUS8_9SPHI|nr:bifunctional 4-hydroxy-2-oxoglutarate aldolase/2-dehydro-3-deoxy-phosphogluconate aldolase [Mucilaginibacter auburnensis]PJJ84542.1 2-dehydro-3-deoxyphosphogluconate aldolase/(4S)-4-hydroxy-2-oxoglutarate aldolase [Mucilaginibacter auburnensis]
MKQQSFSEELFLKVPIIGIVRGMPFNTIKNILSVYADAGLTTIEITMNTNGATEMIKFIAENFGDKLNVGAGTVCNINELNAALNAGAQFIVTPVVNQNVIESCVKKDVPIFPGAFTPTEIYNAWEMGAYMVKVFPATMMGPAYIKEVKAPLNKIKLAPTGGITLKNIDDYKKAGADGYGMAGALFDKNLIEQENWSGLKAHLQQFADKFKR